MVRVPSGTWCVVMDDCNGERLSVIVDGVALESPHHNFVGPCDVEIIIDRNGNLKKKITIFARLVDLA